MPQPLHPAVDPTLVVRAARRIAFRNPRYDRITPVRLRVLRWLADGVARPAGEIEPNSPETLSRLVNLGFLTKDRATDRLRQPWVYAITDAGRAVVEHAAALEARRASVARRRTARANALAAAAPATAELA